MTELLARQIEDLRLLVGSNRDPEGRAFAQLADALRRDGRLREALAVALEGVEQHPRFTPGHVVLGWIAQDSGDWATAEAAFRKTVDLDPGNAFGLFGLGRILAARGEDRGVELVELARELDPGLDARAPAPEVPDTAPPPEPPPTAEEGATADSLEALPFVALADLAPDSPAAEMEALPFVALADLAPDEEDEPPFISLADLAPEPAASEEREAPFVSLADLAPEPAPAEEAEGPFLSLAELAPESTPAEATDEVSPDPAPPVDSPPEPAPPVQVSPEPLPLVETAPQPSSSGGPVVTRTMADLLVRQGLFAQAEDVYRQLLADAPGDPDLLARLGELEELKASAGSSPPAPGDGGDAPSPTTSGPPSNAGIPPVPEVPHPDEESLLAVEPHPDLPSPFHMDDEEEGADEPAGSQPVAGYFDSLLSWSPGHRPESPADDDEPRS